MTGGLLSVHPEEVAHMSLLVILQYHIIAILQSRQYWNKAAPTSFWGMVERVEDSMMRAQPPLVYIYQSIDAGGGLVALPSA